MYMIWGFSDVLRTMGPTDGFLCVWHPGFSQPFHDECQELYYLPGLILLGRVFMFNLPPTETVTSQKQSLSIGRYEGD